jgi:hypothetical protein
VRTTTRSRCVWMGKGNNQAEGKQPVIRGGHNLPQVPDVWPEDWSHEAL